MGYPKYVRAVSRDSDDSIFFAVEQVTDSYVVAKDKDGTLIGFSRTDGRSQSSNAEIWRLTEADLCPFKRDEHHDFGEAIRRMRHGIRQSRVGWNGKGMWLALQVPDEHSKMRRPYIYMSDAQGLLVPWLASQTDMLAEDWCDATATA